MSASAARKRKSAKTCKNKYLLYFCARKQWLLAASLYKSKIPGQRASVCDYVRAAEKQPLLFYLYRANMLHG